MRALLLARGVILETLESNLFISPLLFKNERPQAWDVAKRQQQEKKKKNTRTRNTLRTKETPACEQEMKQLYTHKYLLGPPT